MCSFSLSRVLCCALLSLRIWCLYEIIFHIYISCNKMWQKYIEERFSLLLWCTHKKNWSRFCTFKPEQNRNCIMRRNKEIKFWHKVAKEKGQQISQSPKSELYPHESREQFCFDCCYLNTHSTERAHLCIVGIFLLWLHAKWLNWPLFIASLA